MYLLIWTDREAFRDPSYCRINKQLGATKDDDGRTRLKAGWRKWVTNYRLRKLSELGCFFTDAHRANWAGF